MSPVLDVLETVAEDRGVVWSEKLKALKVKGRWHVKVYWGGGGVAAMAALMPLTMRLYFVQRTTFLIGIRNTFTLSL